MLRRVRVELPVGGYERSPFVGKVPEGCRQRIGDTDQGRGPSPTSRIVMTASSFCANVASAPAPRK